MVTILHWLLPQWFPATSDLPPAIAGLIIFLEFALWWNCRPSKPSNYGLHLDTSRKEEAEK